MKGKPPRLSHVEMIQQVLPGDTNPHGTVFGGKVMQWIDIAGAVSAMRHVKGPVVTASFDRVDFLAPGKLGHIMVLKGQVNYSGRTSLEVGVEVHAEDPMTGERVMTTKAVITYVAIDAKGRPVPVPRVLPETAEEKRRFHDGEVRRKARK
ncbi:MAG: acyl-CoA thioesterase [Pseudomonadota bacterium]